jgi:hypothetical protein
MLFLCEDDGASGLRAVLLKAFGSATVNGQRLGELAVGVEDGDDVALGATTDAAITTDESGTISAKLRGLLKWAAERMPANLGQTTMSGSLPVVVASDQSAMEIEGDAAEDAAASGNPVLSGGRYDSTARSLDDGDVGALAVDAAGRQIVVTPSFLGSAAGGEYTVSNSSDTYNSGSSAQVVPERLTRRYVRICNDSDVTFYLAFNASASANSGIRLASGDHFEINWNNMFTGAINGVPESGTVKRLTWIEVY